MIVLTGGAGFIGSVLLRRLNSQGYRDIVVVDELGKDSKWKNLRKSDFLEYVHKDSFFEWASSAGRWESIDFVFHNGACSNTTERDLDYLYATNVDFSINMARACAKHDIPLLYASSAATYGDGSQGFSDQRESFAKLKPINPYGWSKHLVDKWFLSDSEPTPNHWFGLKYFNVYGPNEYHKEDMKSLVAKAYPQIKENRQIKLFKSYRDGYAHGEQKRDFIYVQDIADISMYIFENYKRLDSGIYNAGTGKARSFKDLAHAVFTAMDISPKIEWIEMPDAIKGQYQYFTQADLTCFRSIIPESALSFTKLEDGVSQYIDILNSNDSYF